MVAFSTDPLAAGAQPAASAKPLLTTRGLTKRFPGVTAVDHADLDIGAGEIVALLGPNGAGKSTFILMLSGVHVAGSYEGEITFAGQPYRPASVSDAEREGIVLIPQEVNVVPDRTVGQNMFLNSEPTRYGMIDWPGLYAAASAELQAFGVDVPADARMGSLDLATQQLVIIARALAKRARLLILDEPTAALTESETSRLFDRLRELRRRGVAIIFVSHRLSEVFAIADRILVMRDGRMAGDHQIASVSREAVVREMVGALSAITPRVVHRIGGAALEVEHLTVRDPEQRERVHVDDVGLVVHVGEILGLFGLVGAGASAVAQAIFGAWTGSIEGSLRLFGREIPTGDPVASVEAGIGMLSQDRRETLVADHSVADNIVLASLRSVAPRGFLDVERKRVVARDQVASLRIRARSIDDRVGSLSGGNQQKVQVARWLTAGARVLLLDDPTRGVDVGARAEIHGLLTQLVADGCAVLWVSSDAEELFEVCDRVLVMRQGRIVAELSGGEATEERLLSAAAGV